MRSLTSIIIAEGEFLLLNLPGVLETTPVWDEVIQSGRAE